MKRFKIPHLSIVLGLMVILRCLPAQADDTPLNTAGGININNTDTARLTGETETATERRNRLEALQRGLIGSWEVNLQGDLSEAIALYSFLDGGILIQSENPMTDPMLGNLVFSNAHGAWQLNADGSFSIRYFKLVYQADASFLSREETTGKLRFDTNNQLVGELTIGNAKTALPSVRFVGRKINAAGIE